MASCVHNLDEVFGDRNVEDREWMALADARGWVAVCKDGRIRRRRGERELMALRGLRVFCLANGNLTRELMVDGFRHNLGAMFEQAPLPGPWLFGLYADGISSLTLYPR